MNTWQVCNEHKCSRCKCLYHKILCITLGSSDMYTHRQQGYAQGVAPSMPYRLSPTSTQTSKLPLKAQNGVVQSLFTSASCKHAPSTITQGRKVLDARKCHRRPAYESHCRMTAADGPNDRNATTACNAVRDSSLR